MERPKRRKSKDNPYTIEERNGKYIVSFIDGEQKSIEVEVSKEIYECFDGFELDDLSQMNEYDRHTEHGRIYNRLVCGRFSRSLRYVLM